MVARPGVRGARSQLGELQTAHGRIRSRLGSHQLLSILVCAPTRPNVFAQNDSALWPLAIQRCHFFRFNRKDGNAFGTKFTQRHDRQRKNEHGKNTGQSGTPDLPK